MAIEKRTAQAKAFAITAVQDEVKKAVGDIGSYGGRRYVKAYIAATTGLEIGEARVGEALKACYPGDHIGRQARAQEHFNPVPYHAEYFGHKLHMDQNEKLVNFGATHVAAIDGYSGFIVAYATMPVKNNIVIYDKIFRKALLDHGIWDQIVVDQGREFYLTLSAQDAFKDRRYNTTRAPYLQIKSTKNNRVERVWVEVNQRVNYPIKAALENLVQASAIDRDDPYHRFAISWVACEISSAGLDRHFQARNARFCRNRGIPQQLMQANTKTVRVDPALVMSGEEAAESYRRNGGVINDAKLFGVDPAAEDQQLQRQRLDYVKTFSHSPTEIYSLLANKQNGIFCDYCKHVLGAVMRFRPGMVYNDG